MHVYASMCISVYVCCLCTCMQHIWSMYVCGVCVMCLCLCVCVCVR
uniref:Uncharacterized protein n=1 Tax=Anguilla anguilla TaxID=7936 RepID=A0A0E9QZK4_ANGAN